MAIEVGSIVEGVVTGITNFGAFVELPEKKVGLVHISEVADEYVRDVHDFLEENQKIKVKVLSIDEKGKIGLSIKALEDKKEGSAKPQGHAHAPGFHSSPRPQGGRGPRDFRRSGGRFSGNPRMNASFEDKLSKFLKDSDERLTDLRRKTDSKRGGRGSRRD
ncbi:MAG: S1 domain-containing RNA-binding protein [Selenomonadaceae bacterium]|nr:S1 domain-containing RNA-binding protein [Selenomonadaceae bacterium]